MKNYISLDGNKIEISKETAENFKKKFNLDKYDIYLKKHPNVYIGLDKDYKAFRTKIDSRDVICVPTPITNNKYYEAAFNWAIGFVKTFFETYIWIGEDRKFYILLPRE